MTRTYAPPWMDRTECCGALFSDPCPPWCVNGDEREHRDWRLDRWLEATYGARLHFYALAHRANPGTHDGDSPGATARLYQRWSQLYHAVHWCQWTTRDECATARERSVAGRTDRIPDCPIHGPHPEEV